MRKELPLLPPPLLTEELDEDLEKTLVPDEGADEDLEMVLQDGTEK